MLGLALAVSFGACFLTGVYSHLAQHPPGWFTLPARPAGLYRVTQGVHVISGIAFRSPAAGQAVDRLPRLVQWPPVRGVGHALERISLLPLVGGSLFLLFSGVANIEFWYPFPFFFPRAHFWVAWLTVRSVETGSYDRSDVNAVQAADPDTLLALRADGEDLALDHGYPVRLVGPNRPGVSQTKWLGEIEVRA